MTDRPIIFSGPMVRAILAGAKTQTRRLIRWPAWIPLGSDPLATQAASLGRGEHIGYFREGQRTRSFTPRFVVGDRLWVRETWATSEPQVAAYRADGRRYGICPDGDGGRIFIAHERLFEAQRGFLLPLGFGVWRSPIHMPRWASRLALTVTGVRVEQLSDITEADAEAEGIREAGALLPHLDAEEIAALPARLLFAEGWDAIHGPGAWDRDRERWVWVVAFAPESVMAALVAANQGVSHAI